jgi:CheY-like chemotaxis protein
MAHILLVDPDDTARRALHGILARGRHRLAVAGNAPEAWDLLTRAGRVDLVFVEPGRKDDDGMAFVARLRQDLLLRALPVVVYAAQVDRELVKRGLELKMQNLLIKPYHDEAIFAEIAKATAQPWRERLFEDEKAFCHAAGCDAAYLRGLLESLRTALEMVSPALAKAAELRAPRLAVDTLRPMLGQAEDAGAPGVLACLRGAEAAAGRQAWEDFARHLESLRCASRIISLRLEPSLVPPEFLAVPEQSDPREARERERWFRAPAEQRCPVTRWAQLQAELDALAGCPIIDSVAASFQMSANGHPSCLSPLMDLVDKDPGLATQLLLVANQARDPDDFDSEPIEDPRVAVGLLGETQLAAQAKALVAVPEHLMAVQAFSWRQYWMFQAATAHTARYACEALEMPNLAAPACTAGLLHGIGRLLLLHLHPFALPAILEHAWRCGLPLAEAERLFLDATTPQMAAHFAEKHALPRRYVHVLRWIDTPEAATEDRDLVAVVSLARDLCRQNHVGSDGEKLAKRFSPLEETQEWAVLRDRVFPSFDLKKFEHQVHARCRDLKLELQGRSASRAVA